jgi:hypothetical protein
MTNVPLRPVVAHVTAGTHHPSCLPRFSLVASVTLSQARVLLSLHDTNVPHTQLLQEIDAV